MKAAALAQSVTEGGNQHGITVLEATLTGRLPGAAERAVLAAIVAESSSTSDPGSDP